MSVRRRGSPANGARGVRGHRGVETHRQRLGEHGRRANENIYLTLAERSIGAFLFLRFNHVTVPARDARGREETLYLDFNGLRADAAKTQLRFTFRTVSRNGRFRAATVAAHEAAGAVLH